MDIKKQFYHDTLNSFHFLCDVNFSNYTLLTNMWIIFCPKTKQLDKIGFCFILVSLSKSLAN